MKQVLEESIKINGPVYIRMSAMDCPDIYTNENKFQIGKATILKKGSDITLVSTGTMMNEAMQVSELLEKEHEVSSEVLQMASIKPLDIDSISNSIKKTGKIVTIEDHNIIGGLGSAVSEVVAEIGTGKIIRIGINDHFTDTVGTPEYLLEHEFLTANAISSKVLNFLEN
jgi:transketolase